MKSRVSGMCRTAAQATTAPIGRLIRKTARHEIAPTRKPPTSGPTALATPLSPDQIPIARARCAGRMQVSISARLPGVMSAAPTPWTSRAPIRKPIVGAAAQRPEATENTAMPARKILTRPKRSPSEPPRSISEARARR